MEKIKFKVLYKEYEEKGTFNDEPSFCDTSYERGSNINTIMKDLGITRFEDAIAYANNLAVSNYGEECDWSFEEAQNIKASIHRKWAHLTPEAKAKFGSPQEFFRYASDPQNYLIEKVEEKTPTVLPEPPVEPVEK